MTADPLMQGLVALADVFGSVRPDLYQSKDLVEQGFKFTKCDTMKFTTRMIQYD